VKIDEDGDFSSLQGYKDFRILWNDVSSTRNQRRLSLLSCLLITTTREQTIIVAESIVRENEEERRSFHSLKLTS
jgi:hypothetical protein